MTNMNNKFEADTGKILDIVINSLYSEREIFLRELISNASDELDKRKYRALTDKNIANSLSLLHDNFMNKWSKSRIIANVW